MVYVVRVDQAPRGGIESYRVSCVMKQRNETNSRRIVKEKLSEILHEKEGIKYQEVILNNLSDDEMIEAYFDSKQEVVANFCYVRSAVNRSLMKKLNSFNK